jgi:imidazolonepropionase-like amidohydrolase
MITSLCPRHPKGPVITEENVSMKRRDQFGGSHTARWLAAATLMLFAIVPMRISAQTPPALLVIEGGTLIDGNGGPPIPNALIVIRGNKIELVSQGGKAPSPTGATVIHANGKFILPGLIDAHLHYSGFLAELLLAHGVTTAFDISGRNLYQVVQRDAIARGRLVGPRLFVPVDSVLAPTHAGGVAYGREGPRGALSIAQAVQIARGAIADGADYLNIRRGLTDEAFRAVVDVAHKAGLAVIAQPIGPTVYAREAVLAGADILEHAAGVSYSIVKDPSRWRGWGDDELHSLDVRPYAEMDDAKAADLIKLMVERNVYLELDLVAEGRGLTRQRKEWELQDFTPLSNPDLAYIPEGVRAKWLANYSEFDAWPAADREQLAKGFENYKKFVGWFVKAGGKVMMGDDTSYSGWAVPGVGIHHELELLVDAGLTPMQAIMAATRNPAEGFRVLDKLGTVEAGKFADLVILHADPLADIRNTQQIEAVIKDGKVLDRAYHRSFTDAFAGDDLDSPDWYRALKRLTEEEGVRTLAGLTDPTSAFGQPSPGIESLTPLIKMEAGPSFTLTIKGVNFTTKSTVYWAERPIPATLVSATELQATIDPSLIARAGMFPIQVKNPGPSLSQPKWGNTSNRASFIVNVQ